MSENPSLQERYAAAWCDVKQPELDGANPHYKSRYATLAAVQGCIRKACAKHGIAYAQRVKLENGEAVLVSEVVGAGDALHLSDYPVQQRQHAHVRQAPACEHRLGHMRR